MIKLKIQHSYGRLATVCMVLSVYLKFGDFQSVLGYEIRKKGTPHNCLDDASAAMKLVLAIIERRVDNDVPLLQEDVS